MQLIADTYNCFQCFVLQFQSTFSFLCTVMYIFCLVSVLISEERLPAEVHNGADELHSQKSDTCRLLGTVFCMRSGMEMHKGGFKSSGSHSDCFTGLAVHLIRCTKQLCCMFWCVGFALHYKDKPLLFRTPPEVHSPTPSPRVWAQLLDGLFGTPEGQPLDRTGQGRCSPQEMVLDGNMDLASHIFPYGLELRTPRDN